MVYRKKGNRWKRYLISPARKAIRNRQKSKLRDKTFLKHWALLFPVVTQIPAGSQAVNITRCIRIAGIKQTFRASIFSAIVALGLIAMEIYLITLLHTESPKAKMPARNFASGIWGGNDGGGCRGTRATGPSPRALNV